MSPRRWDEFAPCKVPLRRVPNVFGLPGLTVHEGIVNDVLWAHRRWEQLGGKKFWTIRAGDTGFYNCRNSVAHSRAIGGDWNWSTNGMTSKRTPCPGDMPVAFYEECWKPIGYGWGANWRSKCDRMHISKVPSEGGDGWLYVVHDAPQPEPKPEPKPIEEDDVAFAVLSAAQERLTIPVYKPGKVHLAIDLGGPAKVRVAIGKAGTDAQGKSQWKIHNDVVVKVGERKTFDIPQGSSAQMVSLKHLEGGAVGVLVV